MSSNPARIQALRGRLKSTSTQATIDDSDEEGTKMGKSSHVYFLKDGRHFEENFTSLSMTLYVF